MSARSQSPTTNGMDPPPVPRTPLSQIRTRSSPAPTTGDGATTVPAAAEEVINLPRDSVSTWPTDKIDPFAPAAEDQRIVVVQVGRALWEQFRSMSILIVGGG